MREPPVGSRSPAHSPRVRDTARTPLACRSAEPHFSCQKLVLLRRDRDVAERSGRREREDDAEEQGAARGHGRRRPDLNREFREEPVRSKTKVFDDPKTLVFSIRDRRNTELCDVGTSFTSDDDATGTTVTVCDVGNRIIEWTTPDIFIKLTAQEIGSYD